jgi:xanthine dehydrogenase molybdopterin-binding subunit B
MATENTQAVKFVKQRVEQRFTHWHNRVETVSIAEITKKLKESHWWQFRKRRQLKLELFGAALIQQTIKGAIAEIRMLN